MPNVIRNHAEKDLVAGAVYGALATGVLTIGGMFGGWVVDGEVGEHTAGWIDGDEQTERELKEALAIAENYPTATEEYRQAQTHVEESIAPSCLKVLGIYVEGGELEETSTDGAVFDVLNLPDQPCGEVTTDIRISLERLDHVRSVDAGFLTYDFNTEYTEALANYDAFIDDKEHRADLSAAWLGLRTGLLGTGAWLGSILGARALQDGKRRRGA